MKNVEHTFWPDANFLGWGSMQFLQAKLSFTMITSNFSGLMNLFYLEGNVPKKWLGNPQDGWINGFSSYNFENYELWKNVLDSGNFALKSSIYQLFPWMTENV